MGGPEFKQTGPAAQVIRAAMLHCLAMIDKESLRRHAGGGLLLKMFCSGRGSCHLLPGILGSLAFRQVMSHVFALVRELARIMFRHRRHEARRNRRNLQVFVASGILRRRSS